jgi:cholesterol transport system auxiliary component
MMTRRQFLLLGGALWIAACTNLIPGTGEGPQLYVLTPKTTFAPDLPKVDWQLLVDVPIAPAEIDTDRIVLQPTPYTVDKFANAAWPDRATVMVQTLLVESFESTGKITAIARESVGLRADYILKPELRKFTAVYDTPTGPPIVSIILNARLVKMPERAIIAQKTFDHRERASRNEMEAIVEAFDGALGKILKRTIEWTLTTAR